MKKEAITKSVNMIIPFFVGGVTGAGLALLFAPKPGKEVRKDVKRFATSAKDRVALAIDKGKEVYEDGRTAVVNAIDAGKDAFVQEKEKWLHA
jgi:gas vesicle protein